jgi:multidrug efflux pump subunit AcrB
MIDAILAFSIRQRWFVMIGVLAVVAFGAWNFTRLPIDAVPDITNVQVQVNVEAAGYSPLEVEQRITFPVETNMSGIPNLQYTRSLSRYGLSQVTIVFNEGTNIYFARQQVSERLQQVKDQLPTGIEIAMGRSPPASVKSTPSLSMRSPAPRTPTGRRSRPSICAPCRTGSSSRSSGRCRGSLKSTPSAATRSSFTCCRIPAS